MLDVMPNTFAIFTVRVYCSFTGFVRSAVAVPVCAPCPVTWLAESFLQNFVAQKQVHECRHTVLHSE